MRGTCVAIWPYIAMAGHTICRSPAHGRAELRARCQVASGCVSQAPPRAQARQRGPGRKPRVAVVCHHERATPPQPPLSYAAPPPSRAGHTFMHACMQGMSEWMFSQGWFTCAPRAKTGSLQAHTRTMECATFLVSQEVFKTVLTHTCICVHLETQAETSGRPAPLNTPGRVLKGCAPAMGSDDCRVRTGFLSSHLKLEHICL